LIVDQIIIIIIIIIIERVVLNKKLVQNTSLVVDFLDLSTHHSIAGIDLEEV
jgi:hypothetical protein